MLAGGMFSYGALGDDWRSDRFYLDGHPFECKRSGNDAKCEKVYKLADGVPSGWVNLRKGLPASLVKKMEEQLSKLNGWPNHSQVKIHARWGWRVWHVAPDNPMFAMFDPERGGGDYTLGTVRSVAFVVRPGADRSFWDNMADGFVGVIKQIPKTPGYLVQIGVGIATGAAELFMKAVKAIMDKACDAAKSDLGQLAQQMAASNPNPSQQAYAMAAQGILAAACPKTPLPPPPESQFGKYLPYLIVGGAVAAALLLTSPAPRAAAASTPKKKA